MWFIILFVRLKEECRFIAGRKLLNSKVMHFDLKWLSGIHNYFVAVVVVVSCIKVMDFQPTSKMFLFHVPQFPIFLCCFNLPLNMWVTSSWPFFYFCSKVVLHRSSLWASFLPPPSPLPPLLCWEMQKSGKSAFLSPSYTPSPFIVYCLETGSHSSLGWPGTHYGSPGRPQTRSNFPAFSLLSAETGAWDQASSELAVRAQGLTQQQHPVLLHFFLCLAPSLRCFTCSTL